jgi:LysR family carnitine catabolism transcriptional activator
MINLSLRSVQTFVAVAECGSFRRAAELLNRSQSAVSGSVKQLEDQLGVPLLSRTTRRVSLTAEGRMLLIRSKNALTDLEAVARELRDEVLIRRGRVSFAISPSISASRLPPIIAEYQSRYPEIVVELHEDVAKGMYDRVCAQEVDFAVGPEMDGYRDIAFERIMSDPILVIVPLDYPLAGRTELSLEEIAAWPHLTMPRGTVVRRSLEEAFRSLGLELRPRFEVLHQQTLFSMVKAGLGVTVLPSISVPEDARPGYRVVRLINPKITRQISIITYRGKTLSPPARKCADLIAMRLREQVHSTVAGRKTS